MMKNRFFYLAILLILSSNLIAQESDKKGTWGLSLGTLTYTGRFSVDQPISTRTSIGGAIMYNYKILPKKLYVRGDLFAGRIKGDNVKSEQNGAAQGNFSATMVEFSVKGLYDIIDMDTHKFSPYVFAGGAYYFLAGYKSSFGEKPSADKMSFALPVGGGFKYRASNNLILFLEGDIRYLGKNLDNVNSTNNPNKYFSLGIGILYSPYKKIKSSIL